MKNNKNESGFTLIELVMVIVIVGILTAVALPKFVSLGSDARVGVMKSVQGSMRSANAIIFSKAAMSGMNGAASATNFVTINGTQISLAYGYASDAINLALAMDLIPASDFSTAALTISHNGAPIPTACSVTYAPASATVSVPSYTLNTSC
jgi:MSHA pilin protein MshA